MNAAPISLTENEIATLITAGGRAPSGGNIQPWIVEVTPNAIHLKLNEKKLGTVLDVNNYGSLLALGAFTYNLEAAANFLGLTFIKKIGNPTDPARLGIDYQFLQRGTPHSPDIYQAVIARDTNRQLYDGRLIDNKTFTHLQNLITQYSDYRLDGVSDNHGKSNLAKILGKADLIRTKNLRLLTEMMSEMRWTDSEAQRTKDGLDLKTMELPGNVGKMLQLLAKFPAMAKTVPDLALEKQAWPLLKNCSHLCVLSQLQPPSPESFFQAGYVLEYLWVEATRLKLAFHPWTVLTFFIIRAKYFPKTAFSPTEEALLLSLDKRLQQLLSLPPHSTPIFIFRLSYADPPSARSLRYDWLDYTTLH